MGDIGVACPPLLFTEPLPHVVQCVALAAGDVSRSVDTMGTENAPYTGSSTSVGP